MLFRSANDPHLMLTSPGAFHVVHVRVPGVVDAIGADVPGLPAIVSGHGREAAWGVTALSVDVVDAYADTQLPWVHTGLPSV